MRTITSRFEDEVLTVYLETDIDHHNAMQLRTEIDAEVARYRPKMVILNFDAVGFMDSSGIGLIIGRYKLLQEAGGKLKISALNNRCKKMIDISGITALVGIE